MGCVGKTVRAAASTLFVKPPCALDDSFKIGEAGYVLLSPSPKTSGACTADAGEFFFFFFGTDGDRGRGFSCFELRSFSTFVTGTRLNYY